MEHAVKTYKYTFIVVLVFVIELFYIFNTSIPMGHGSVSHEIVLAPVLDPL